MFHEVIYASHSNSCFIYKQFPFISFRILKFKFPKKNDSLEISLNSMRRLIFDESEENISSRSDTPNSFLIKKTIHKPISNKFTTPSKLMCKNPLSLVQSKSFTPNPHIKQMMGPLELKSRSYSSLESSQILNDFNYEADIILEDSYCGENTKNPYNIISKEQLAEDIKNGEDLVILDCRYAFEYEGIIFIF